MNILETKVVNEALRLLNSIGLPYAIRLPDGEVVGELELAPERTITRSNRWNADLNITDKLQAMSPGETVTIKNHKDVELLENLRGSVCGHANTLFGEGNYRTAIDWEENSVTILRLLPTGETVFA